MYKAEVEDEEAWRKIKKEDEQKIGWRGGAE